MVFLLSIYCKFPEFLCLPIVQVILRSEIRLYSVHVNKKHPRKHYMKNWESILGTSSCFLLLLTIVLLLINFKEGRYHFLALAFYLSQITFLNLDSSNAIRIPDSIREVVVFCHSVLELPMMLVFFLYFAKEKRMRKLIFYIIGAFLVFDMVMYFIKGMTPSLTIIIGPGLMIITAFGFYLFVDSLKLAISKRKKTGKAFLTGASVFAYLCFTLIYILYYIMESEYVNDIYAIYYSTYIIFTVFLIIGLLLIISGKRHAEKLKKMPAKKGIRKEDENAFQFL